MGGGAASPPEKRFVVEGCAAAAAAAAAAAVHCSEHQCHFVQLTMLAVLVGRVECDGPRNMLDTTYASILRQDLLVWISTMPQMHKVVIVRTEREDFAHIGSDSHRRMGEIYITDLTPPSTCCFM